MSREGWLEPAGARLAWPGAGLVFPAPGSDRTNPQHRASLSNKRPKSIVAMTQIVPSFSLWKTNSILTLKYFCAIKPQVKVSTTNLIANMCITVSGARWKHYGCLLGSSETRHDTAQHGTKHDTKQTQNKQQHKINNTTQHSTAHHKTNGTIPNKQHKTNNTTPNNTAQHSAAHHKTNDMKQNKQHDTKSSFSLRNRETECFSLPRCAEDYSLQKIQ